MVKKGYVYTLEVLLAMALIFVTLIFIFRISPPSLQGDIPIIKRYGLEGLEYLEQTNDLRLWVSTGNETAIKDALTQLMPSNIKFQLDICKDSCSGGGIPTTVNVIVTDYYVTTYNGDYLDRKIHLWLWRQF